MKRFILGLLVVFSMVACHQVKRPEKPKNLIPENTMANIILDMSLFSASRGVDKNALDKNNISLQTLIYDKYNVDSLQLAESNEYYSYSIDEYEAIYTKVNDSLTILKEKYTAEEAEAEVRKRKQDSINKKPVNALKPDQIEEIRGLILDVLRFP
ncbi:conserved hypothetical protein (DUF4296) [Formosa agariphila KMM 3901]|uniref:DUF4296 domain-containing protein n=1 Tax=Formosa agariphila (strain DSM 15362 / KCTC 12365 / LMG 23005 / KMM 3901 / M-2Alg 35-1) TaxID=1347342 RepID=T2KQA3_FORAG|nr:DUF4296 domain-containing protein [Formosa agariphila]CDF80905.1 conserved hypothetical protein (DUF4296) [Formosa agariphila KMM 3901]